MFSFRWNQQTIKQLWTFLVSASGNELHRTCSKETCFGRRWLLSIGWLSQFFGVVISMTVS